MAKTGRFKKCTPDRLAMVTDTDGRPGLPKGAAGAGTEGGRESRRFRRRVAPRAAHRAVAVQRTVERPVEAAQRVESVVAKAHTEQAAPARTHAICN